MYNYDQEVYFRAVSLVRKRLLSDGNSILVTKLLKKSGRTMPSIIRPDEEIVFPSSLRAEDSLCFLTGLLCIEENNDLVISEYVDHCLRLARKNQYNGKWSNWSQLIQYFEISEEDNFKVEIRERTIWSLPDYFDFLLTIMSSDDLFGNHLRRAISFMKNLRLRKRRFPSDPKPVKYPQRHRGYRDKGSCADFKKGWRPGESSARRKILPPVESLPKYSSLDQVCIFPKSPFEGGH